MGKRKKNNKSIGNDNDAIKLHIQEPAEDVSSVNAHSLDDTREYTESISESELKSSDQSADIENLQETSSTDELVSTENLVKTSSTDGTVDKVETGKNSVADTTILKVKKRKISLLQVFRIACMGGFVVFTALFLNETLLQPYLAAKASDKAKSLYQMAVINPTTTIDNPNQVKTEDTTSKVERTDEGEIIVVPDPNRDEMGRLLSFGPLLEENPDVKGWIQLLNLNGENDTKIDYVVVQSDPSDPEYYLTRDWLGKKLKSGSIFLDAKSSVERNTKNLVIHGHNMTSTDDMFHYLLKYNDREFYDEHPIINFNSIYETGQWKIFSIFITNGTSDKEELFDYTISDFKSDDDFINFIYQLRIRSIYDIDAVDVNENDQILTLSTCSYEVKNYRTVIVARKVREGEDITVDTSNVYENPSPLYPYSFYYRYGGKAPKLPASFEEAYEKGMIYWYYKPVEGEEVTDRPKREVIPEVEKAKEEKETKKDKEESAEDIPEETTEEISEKKETKKDRKKDTKNDSKKDSKKDTNVKDSDTETKDNTDSESNEEDTSETEPSSTDSNQDQSPDSPTPEMTPSTVAENEVEASPEEDTDVNDSKEPPNNH